MIDIFAKILNIVDNINEMCGKIFGFLNVVLILVVSYEVLARFLFNHPNVWSMETTVYMMGGMAFLGAGYTLLHGGHVKVDIFYKRWSRRTRAWIDIFTYLLLFITCAILIWYGGNDAYESLVEGRKTESAWAPPLWISQSLIPIGAILVFLQGLAKWIRDWVIALTGKDYLASRVAVGEGGIVAMAKEGKEIHNED